MWDITERLARAEAKGLESLREKAKWRLFEDTWFAPVREKHGKPITVRASAVVGQAIDIPAPGIADGEYAVEYVTAKEWRIRATSDKWARAQYIQADPAREMYTLRIEAEAARIDAERTAAQNAADDEAHARLTAIRSDFWALPRAQRKEIADSIGIRNTTDLQSCLKRRGII